jgi:hypothetical protein
VGRAHMGHHPPPPAHRLRDLDRRRARTRPHTPNPSHQPIPNTPALAPQNPQKPQTRQQNPRSQTRNRQPVENLNQLRSASALTCSHDTSSTLCAPRPRRALDARSRRPRDTRNGSRTSKQGFAPRLDTAQI